MNKDEGYDKFCMHIGQCVVGAFAGLGIIVLVKIIWNLFWMKV